MLHLWYHTSAIILAWILEEYLRCDAILVTFMLLLLLYFNILKVAGGWASKCMLFTCVSLPMSCSMLCAAQWQKSPGVFMRKKNKEFTIEDGIYSYIN